MANQLFDVLLPRTAIHPNTKKTEKYPHAFSHSIKFNAMLKKIGIFLALRICGKRRWGGNSWLYSFTQREWMVHKRGKMETWSENVISIDYRL